jgi:hypothetical protein
MVVRIRLKRGPRIQGRRGRNRRFALALGALLTPGALMATALAVWRIAADMNWAGEFAISAGPFSHWQAWIAVAAALETAAIKLNRYGRGGGTAIP